MRNIVRRIPCGDLDVFVTLDAYVNDWHPFYSPAIVLLFIKRGCAWLRWPGEEKSVQQGQFCLVNRGVMGEIKKTWTAEEGHAEMMIFGLHHKFLRSVQDQVMKVQPSAGKMVQNAYVLPQNPILKGLFSSMADYVNEDQTFDPAVVQLKTREALIGILKFHPEVSHLFQVQEKVERIAITDLVESNYMYNIRLEQLAEMSGRSLSTFQREFKALYGMSPHRWIRRRRLQRAKEILQSTERKPVDFYLELGFESLAHFSRVFKQEFGLTLTDFKNTVT